MSTLSQRVAKFAGRGKPAVIAALAVAIPVEKDVDVHAMDEFLSPFVPTIISRCFNGI